MTIRYVTIHYWYPLDYAFILLYCHVVSQKMTDKEKVFCRAYIVSYNGSKAAIEAGYDESWAYQAAHRLLKKAHIKREIARLGKARNKRLDITADKVKTEIAKIAFVDVQGLIKHFDGQKLLFNSLDDVPDQIRPAIKSIKVDKDGCVGIKLWSKENALKMLAEHFNMFKDHQEAGATKIPDFSKYQMNEAQNRLGKKEEE